MNNNYNEDDIIDGKNYDQSLFEILLTYIRHWRWFLVSIIFFMLLAYSYIKLIRPEYKIETDLLIKDNKNNVAGQNDLLKDLNLFSSDKVIDNEIQILKSNTIIEKAITYLKLQTAYYNTEGVRKHEIYEDIPFEAELLKPSTNKESAYKTNFAVKLITSTTVLVNGKKALLNYPINTEAGLIVIKPKPTKSTNLSQLIAVKFNNVDDLIVHYSNSLTIAPASKQSMVLIITMVDAIPKRGKDFLNRLVEEYNLAALDDKNKVTSNTLAFIKERLVVIADELGTTEKNVQQFKSSNRITDINSQSQMFLESVKDNDIELNKVLIQLSVIDNLERYLENNQNESAKLPSTLGIEDPTLLGLVSKLGEAEIKRESLLQTIPETNPIILSLNDEISSLKQTLRSSAQNLKGSLKLTQQQLQAKNNQFEGTIQQVPTKERGLLDVMRQQEIKNALFTYLLQKQEETAMQLASGVADSRIIDYAKSSIEPVKPVKSEIYLLFLLIAIIIPIAVIYTKRLLNYKVIRRLDIEQMTNAPILAEISHANIKDALIVSTSPRSMVSEQIRALRTNLQFIMPEQVQKVILFTSSISGEGKSFVSLNLGGSLAIAGKKVVILELDLRKPKLHKGLEIDNEVGLSNYLIGKASYEDVLKKIPVQDEYYIITSGPIPPNPAELISNGKIESLLDKLKKEFDYIILDAPPIGLVTDAQILAAFADATLFIIRHNYTAKNSVKSIDGFYESKKFKNLNIILNAVDLQMGYGSSYYGYGYGYGYGGGYYNESISNGNSIFSQWFKRKTRN